MGKRQINAIILIVVALAIAGGLHLYAFAPLKQQWMSTNDELSRLAGQYMSIVQEVKKEGATTVTSEEIPSALDQVIRVINEKITTDKDNFDTLNKQLKVVEHYDSSLNFKDEILKEIQQMQQLEQSTRVTKLNVTTPWGVNAGIMEGRFGRGFFAQGGRSKVYASVSSKSVIIPTAGTIEFYVKPDWDPSDTEQKHKCMVLALHKEKMTFDQLNQRVEKYNETHEIPINIGMLVTGQGPYSVESMASVYKGQGATLVFELKNFIQTPTTLTADISDWKKGQWYHIAAIWDSKRQALYINGQNRGIPFVPGTSVRQASDEDLLLGGGAGMGMGMGMYRVHRMGN